MEIGVTLFIIIAVIAGIWLFIEVKRMRHKMFAIFLIALIIFFYVSAIYVFKGKDLDFKSVPGVISATNLYFSWMTNVFYANIKGVTANVIHMDWNSKNLTSSK